MKPKCLCGQEIAFTGRSNVRRCPECHSLQVRDTDGIWVFETTPSVEDFGERTMYIERRSKRVKDYPQVVTQVESNSESCG
jgi:hypothetical protein